MSIFVEVFRVDSKKFFSKFTLICLIVMLSLSAYMVNKGINDYQQTRKNVDSFVKIEKIMFGRLMNYLQYSFWGFRVLFVPGPGVIFFSEPGTMADLSAKIDTITSIDVFNNLKGPALFSDHFPGALRFAGLVLLLGGALAIFSGIGLKRNREYLKFLTGLCPGRKLFPYLFISRAILVTGSFLAILAGQLLLVKLRGVPLTAGDMNCLLVFAGVSVTILLVFFFSGVLMGGLFSTKKARTAGLLIWAILVFVIPYIINAVIGDEAEKLQNYHVLNLNKLKLVNHFEIESERKYGKYNKNDPENRRKIVEIYIKEYYPRISSLEEDVISDLEDLMERFCKLSLFFPASFYTMTCKSVSSRGYGSYTGYLRYLLSMQRKFLRFWIDRVYYHDPKDLVSFIRGEENLYRGQSRVPRYLVPSLVLHLFYILLLFTGSYFCYGRMLVSPGDSAVYLNKEDLKIDLETGKINVFHTRRSGFRDYLYGVLSCRPAANAPGFRLLLDGKAFCGQDNPSRYIYLCDVNELPGHLKCGDFAKMVLKLNLLPAKERKKVLSGLPVLAGKRLGEVGRGQKVDLLLYLLPYIAGDFFIFYHTCKGLGPDYLIRLKDQMQRKVSEGAVVVYLSPDYSVNELKKRPNREIMPLKVWTQQVESLEFLESEKINGGENPNETRT